MALVCANSEDSRESVRSLQSALICADFEKTKCSDSVLKFLIARLQWIGILARTFSGPKIVK